MTTNPSHIPSHRRQLRIAQLAFAGAAAIALLAVSHTAQAETTPVRLADWSTSMQGGFATDDNDDQQAQLQQQLATQEMLQSEQQAEQQNEAAQQQAQLDEQQANNP